MSSKEQIKSQSEHSEENEVKLAGETTPPMTPYEPDTLSETFFFGEGFPEVGGESVFSYSGEGFSVKYAAEEEWPDVPRDMPYMPYRAQEQETEGEGSEESFMFRMESFGKKREGTSKDGKIIPSSEPRQRSIFVHSSPSYFPDLAKARKSVFGSIFLRSTGQIADDATLLQTIADTSYNMLQSLLNSFEKIVQMASTDAERKHMSIQNKEALLKALESRGVTKVQSDGSVHWNIYPIANDYLFTIQIGDHKHQTRHLSRIEERLQTGFFQKLRLAYSWPTQSVWSGHWDGLGMAGPGVFIMPHGVSYTGKMQNGMFHDNDAILTYPNKFKALHCVFERGKLQSCQFQFPDQLMHEKENWNYCKMPDRSDILIKARPQNVIAVYGDPSTTEVVIEELGFFKNEYWSEVKKGLRPAKMAQKTEVDPPRKIPEGCYDTNDGFYNPRTLMLVSPRGELLRVPVCEEDIWIKKYCRKGFHETSEYRPDLYENWFNYDEEFIQKIVRAQNEYRLGKINYDEFQQRLADLDLLPNWSQFKKRKTSSQVNLDEFVKTIPDPRVLKPPRLVKKFVGHKISNSEFREDSLDQVREAKRHSRTSKVTIQKVSKSVLKFTTESRQRMPISQMHINQKASKISFRVDSQDLSDHSSSSTPSKRSIPEKYLKNQLILRPPFIRGMKTQALIDEAAKKRKCKPQSVATSVPSIPGEADFNDSSSFLATKGCKKCMETIILELLDDILLEEREKQRKRLKWAEKIPQIFEKDVRVDHMALLRELFETIPEKDEYCDSDPSRTCDLKVLAEDKYQVLKYWGKRMYHLKFPN